MSAVDWLPEATFEIRAEAEHFAPYEHQLAAWDAMTRHFGEGNTTGMLVVPTGGGKTAIAARWLLRHHIRNGGRVLWLAHRRSLLVQAFNTFVGAASQALPKPTLSQILISSRDKKWSNVASDHDVVFSSVQTACREATVGFVAQMQKQSPQGLFVVVDEAHHAAAAGYRRVLGMLDELGATILGLSATPVRMDPGDEKRLWNLFKSVVYQVRKQTLIDKRILSTPVVETVQTKVEFEREFTDDDVRHLERFGELAPDVLRRVASHSGRNGLIVEHFKKNQSKYGKTLLFAVDTLHAKTLTQEFNEGGISADYVDYTRNDSAEVIASYGRTPDPLVLSNVEMLTEGVDLPATQTVLIVRPTRSEALLSQMIGRALRGVAAGGTENAYLVTFVDTWRDFHPLDTEFVISTGDVPDDEIVENLPRQLVIISEALVLEAYKLVRSNVRGDFEGTYECLPHGWFVWEAEYEDDIQRRPLMVFENQVTGFDALQAAFADTSSIPDEITEAHARELVRRFFGDCQDPLPSWIDVAELLLAKKKGVDIHSYTFKEKEAFNPNRLAREIHDRNVGAADKFKELGERFDNDPICRLVYQGDKQAFFEDVDRELQRLVNVTPPPTPKLVELVPSDPRPWGEGMPGHDLVALWQVVASQPKHFRGKPPTVRDISYMKKPSSMYFGYCRYSDSTIHINPALNSPDVPRFVMEFLVYHEGLHADMPSAGHNRDFRTRERRFVPSDEAVSSAREAGFQPIDTDEGWRLLADQFLDTFQRKYAVMRSAGKVRM